MPRPKKAPSAPLQRPTAPTTKVANIRDWMTQQAQQDLLRFITCGTPLKSRFRCAVLY
jgi:bifunctional enzyme CysN/CysC